MYFIDMFDTFNQ